MYKRLLALGVLALVSLSATAVNLYQEDDYHSLTADRRGQRVGDVITVLVTENSSAAASAGTQTDKSNSGNVNFTNPKKQKNYALGLTENFDGNGKISRTGRLLAQLSVTIVSVEPNGDLVVKGDQNIEINGEKQSIRLEGRVRPVDVSEANTIPSSRISNAKITYIGDGVLAESQHKGWLSHVLSYLGLI